MPVRHGPVDIGRQAVAQAVRVPAQREGAVGLRFGKGRVRQRVMVLACGVARPGDDAAHELQPRLAGKALLGVTDYRILAGAARANHRDEDAVADRQALGQLALDDGRDHHATRRLWRHTVRTTGTWSSTRTRTRSARRPGSMTPRSVRPTA